MNQNRVAHIIRWAILESKHGHATLNEKCDPCSLVPKVPYLYEVNGQLVAGNGSLIPICSLTNCFLLTSLTVLNCTQFASLRIFVSKKVGNLKN